MRVERLWFMAVMLTLAGCGGAGGADRMEGIVTRDSAGVEIIEHSAAAVEAVPVATLGAATFSIGGESAEDTHDATDLRRGWLREDGILALNTRESSFMRFDGTGALLTRYGRRGQGPDEYQAMVSTRIEGDSLLLAEMTRSSVRVLRADLTPGPETAFGEGPSFEYQIVGMTPDGGLLAIHRTMQQLTERGGPPGREPLNFVHRAAGAATWDTVLTSVAEMAYPTVYKEGTHEVPMRRPFTFGAVPLHGIWGGRIVVADNGSWRIDSHGPDGALVRSTRFALPLRPVTQAMRDSVFAREERQIPENVAVPQAILDQFLEMSRGQQFADSVAPYDRIFVARDGDLWIRQNEMPVDTATTWMRIGRNGQLAARLQLPRGWALLDADQARVLIRRTDDLDLGYLEILPIRMGDQ